MKKKKWMVVISVLIAVVCLCGFYLHFENTALVTTNYAVSSEKIPAEFNNFKIAQVSDLHNTDSPSLVKDLVESIKKEKPDIIALTGDLIDSNRTDVDIAVNFVHKISDVATVYFVTGNHEAAISNYSELAEKLKENNVMILNNKSLLLTRGEASVNLIGINDPLMAYDNIFTDSEKVRDELDNTNYNKDYYSILLSHRPELLSSYADEKIDLVLSGHAHGGQIRIPFIGGLIAPNQGIFPKYTNGTYQDGNTKMIVSRGVGNSVLPFRINNRPELVIVELHEE